MRPTSHWLRQFSFADASTIADLFHIKPISNWDYEVKTKNSQRDEKTFARITDSRAISVLAFVENMGKEYNHHQIVNDMHKVLLRLRLTVAEEVCILEKGDESGKVLQTADFVNHFGNELTYFHSASHLFVAPEFARVLKEQLKLNNSYMDRILPMFISCEYDEFTKYLEKFCGYNLADMPNVKVDEPNEKAHVGSNLLPSIYFAVPIIKENSASAASDKIPAEQKESGAVPKEASASATAASANTPAKATGSVPKEASASATAASTKMPAEEKAKRFQFIQGFKLTPKDVIFEGDMMDLEDITDKVRIFVLKEVNQYSRIGKSHEWGRGVVFQHLLHHYMNKFRPDMKVADMQSPTHIRFISKDHRRDIDVQWFKADDKTSKKDFDGDIHVTKRAFNKEGKLITEKVNKIAVKASHIPKPEVAANVHLHWSKSKKEICLSEGNKSLFTVDEKATKQLQTSSVKVKF